MATLKHIASKNSDYTAIEAYLVYQHDAFTGKQLLDEQGRPMLRESYLLDTLECGDFSFATACLLANRKYGKNTQHGDIKSHQYIISFDPRDAADNGLTMEKAQALGLKFCEENFPGHPAIVCTHPDGHNHSGNIHVHIVIGSIRTREVERTGHSLIAGDSAMNVSLQDVQTLNIGIGIVPLFLCLFPDVLPQVLPELPLLPVFHDPGGCVHDHAQRHDRYGYCTHHAASTFFLFCS